MGNSFGSCFTDWLKTHGVIIFYVAIAAIATLLLIVIVLIITLCCVCCRKRKPSSDAESEEAREETNSGKKGDALRMVEVGGEATAEGKKAKNKTKASDRTEDAGLENFAEAMYATVDKPTDSQTKQTGALEKLQNVDLITDGDNYDIITHVEEDESAPGKQPKFNKNSNDKSASKAAKKSKEKKAAPEMVIAEAEYSVPDKTRKQKKQNGQKASTNLEQAGGPSTSIEYNTLLHVTSNTQRLSMPTAPNTSEYSVIAQQDNKRNSATSDVGSSNCQNGRQRGRTNSPPEAPPPLPPPFVDEENPTINNARINPLEELALYDDPDSLAVSEPQQEMYMNVGKR